MALTFDVPGILQDENFKTLCVTKTSHEEFLSLVESKLPGYVQRKRLLDGLRDFKAKVEAAETKLKVARNVGKAKQMDPEDEALLKHHDSYDIADKVTSLNKIVVSMLDEGQVTAEERPLVLENLKTRMAKAKATEGKEKVAEKLDKQMTAIIRAKPFKLPVNNLAEIAAYYTRLQEIHRLEKRPPKTLDDEERERMGTRAQVQFEVHSLEAKSRMWFEGEFEWQPRLSKALEDYARTQEEERKRAEDEAKEKQRQAEELAIQMKKEEARLKEEEAHKQMMQKLEAKRLEAQMKPQKEAPKAKAKEKKRVIKMDAADFFQPPPREDTPEASPEPSDDEDPRNVPAEPPSKAPAAAPTVSVVHAAPAAPVPAPKPKAAPRQPKPELENKWGAPPPVPDYLVPDEEELAAVGPSLADAKNAPKVKQQIPVVKDKDKKKTWGTEHQAVGFQPPFWEVQHASGEEEDDDWRALPSTSMEDEGPPEPTPAEAAKAVNGAAPPEATVAAEEEEESPEAEENEKTPEKPQPKVRSVKAPMENRWDTSAPLMADSLEEGNGPSLAEAAGLAQAGAKKGAPPPPKKKEKKKFAKMSVADLGFDCNNPNYH